MRVLIIDDSAVMRKIVESALRHAGLDLAAVLLAANGVEALAALESLDAHSQPIDLILCDVHMPLLDGPGFLLEKSRRALAPHAPVVMITADASDPHLLHAVAAGAQGYISKPFTLDQVRLRVATLLHNSTCNPQPAPASHPEQVGGAP